MEVAVLDNELPIYHATVDDVTLAQESLLATDVQH